MDDHVKKRLLDSNYVDSYQPGLGAIKKQHREKIMINNSRNLQGSMDVDKSCKDSEPNSPRWDYLVVILKNNQENLALIEIHGAAKPRNAKEMIKKKAWLNQWLINVRLVDFKKKYFGLLQMACLFYLNPGMQKNWQNQGYHYQRELPHT